MALRTRRVFAVLVAAALTGCQEPGRNILLVSIDTLRADHLGAYGYPRDTSPAIDALAAESVLFEQAYSHSPKTAASHMSLMTGLLPEAHGVRNWVEVRNQRLSDDIPTLAALLREAGYRTHGMHSGGNVRGELGFDQGFDAYDQAGFGDAAKLLSELRDDGRPFFLFVHTYEAHDPYVAAPAETVARFADPAYAGRIPSTRGALAEAAGSLDWADQHRVYWERVDPESPADVRHLIDLYDAGIRHTDARLAELLDELRELDLDAHTLVVVLSDHGEEFREHDGFLHETVYEEVLRVPLLMRFPGRKAAALRGRRVAELVRLVDVMPTLLDWAGVPTPDRVQGRSLLPLLQGAEEPPRRVVSQWRGPGLRALREGDWKYVQGRSGEELYRLSTDTGESRSLHDAHPDVAAELRAALEREIGAAAEIRRAAGSGAEVAPDAELRRQLQALGYLSGE